MVLYFSATGNTKYIAETLAELLEDECLNLLPRIKSRDVSAILSEKPFVICAPIYVAEMPRFLASYLRKVPLFGNRNVYFVSTSGGYSGVSGVLAGELIQKKGMEYKGSSGFKMPRNYIANNVFSQSGQAEIEKLLLASAKRLPEIARTIRSGGVLKSKHVWLLELWITVPFNPVWCRINQPTPPFHVNDTCISCGKCGRLCPVNAITMVNGKPLWTKESCAHCMSCIQNCPVEAIEYGNITQQKKRYLFEKYRYVLEDKGQE